VWEKLRHSNIKNFDVWTANKEIKWKISQMGVHIGAHRHANCSDQGCKCLATHLSWDWQPVNFPEFKSGIVSECFTWNIPYFYMLGWYTWHTGFFYYTKAILMRREHRNNAPTTIAVGRHCTGALNNWGKMKICKKHQTFEAIG